MRSGLRHPPIRLGITDQSEEPDQEGDPVCALQTELGRMRCEAVSECSGVVKDFPDGIHHDLGDRLGILVVPQEVRRDPRRPGDWEALKGDPLPIVDVAHVDADIRTAGLSTPQHGELVPIGWKVPDAVDGRRRSV